MKTLKECQTIVTNSKLFTMTTQIQNGDEIITFDYQDGTKFRDFEEHNAFHMRGITFVNGECFPMLDKFFNLGERHIDEIEEAKLKTIQSIQIKDDGSLIGFLILSDGNVIAKTKVGLSNPFTDIANNFLKENNNDGKIRDLYNEGIFPLFECVSDKQTIVLKYEWEGLKLIQARRKDGTFLTVEELAELAEKNDFVFEKPLVYTLEELLKIKDTQEGIEGFIIRFDDGSFTKVKTSWYFDKHASDDGIIRANELLKAVLNGSNIAEEEYERVFVEDSVEKVLTPFSITSLDELKAFLFRDGDKKDVGTYQQIFKTFLKEYSLANNYDNENTIIKLTLENSIDDILPLLGDFDRKKVESIQSKVLAYFEENVNRIVSILEENITHKEMNQKYKGTPMLGLALNNNGKEWNRESIEKLVKAYILKNNRKLQPARDLIDSL